MLYDHLTSALEKEYGTVRVMKENERGSVILLCHKKSGQRFVFHHYKGNGDVYRKLLKISCTGLPQILEVAQKDGMTAVLEEYIQGDSLAMLLEADLFTPEQTKRIARQVCQALWVLHSLGAVHRDVKPENVILRGDEAVLIDFDASRVVKSDKKEDTQALGTTGYAPPEQYGMAQTGPQSDIYALGVMMNVMLTGEHPSKKLAPGHLGRVIQRCTQISPGRRYKNVLRLMEDIR